MFHRAGFPIFESSPGPALCEHLSLITLLQLSRAQHSLLTWGVMVGLADSDDEADRGSDKGPTCWSVSALQTKVRKVCSLSNKVYGWVRDILACVSARPPPAHSCTSALYIRGQVLVIRCFHIRKEQKQSVSLQSLLPKRMLRKHLCMLAAWITKAQSERCRRRVQCLRHDGG